MGELEQVGEDRLLAHAVHGVVEAHEVVRHDARALKRSVHLGGGHAPRLRRLVEDPHHEECQVLVPLRHAFPLGVPCDGEVP